VHASMTASNRSTDAEGMGTAMEVEREPETHVCNTVFSSPSADRPVVTEPVVTEAVVLSSAGRVNIARNSGARGGAAVLVLASATISRRQSAILWKCTRLPSREVQQLLVSVCVCVCVCVCECVCVCVWVWVCGGVGGCLCVVSDNASLILTCLSSTLCTCSPNHQRVTPHSLHVYTYPLSARVYLSPLLYASPNH
jgi:hypothetical protein